MGRLGDGARTGRMSSVRESAGKTFLEARWGRGLVGGQRTSTSRPGLGLETLGEGEHGLVPMILATAAAWRAQRHDYAQLIEPLTPELPEIPASAAVLQARRNAEARNTLLAEFGGLRSSEIAELAGSRAANRAALANRLRSKNRLVAVLRWPRAALSGLSDHFGGGAAPGLSARRSRRCARTAA